MSIFDKLFNKSKYKFADDYFLNIKNNLNEIDPNKLKDIVSFCRQQLKKAKDTQQNNLENKFKNKLYEVQKELIAIESGFVKYVEANALQEVVNVSKKPIRIVRQENYEREIPDKVIDILKSAKEIKCNIEGKKTTLFESFYIAYTDLSSMSKKEAQKAYNKSKDPILFACVIDSAEVRFSHKDENYYMDNGKQPKSLVKMFFIADWTDKYCDLTFNELVDIASQNEIKSISTKEEDIEPNEIIDKAKEEIKG